MGKRVGRLMRHMGLTFGAAGAVLSGLSCSGGDITGPTTGTLKITTATTGADPDPDGYTFTVDGGAPQPIGVNASASLANLAAGSHSVQLSGLAQNCTVQGDNPRSVTLAGGATADVTFAITCSATTGSIQVTTATTGSSLDPDGYTASVDGGAAQSIGINATLIVPNLAPGSHSVALAGLARNCQPQGDNQRTVEIIPASTATVTFSVSCAAIPPIAFTSFDALDNAVAFLVNPDGTGLTKLTDGRAPIWSPDGHKILFRRSGDDLYVINADGSGEVNLVKHQEVDDYRWSPDGRRIAFITTTCVDPNCEASFTSLRVMRADGSGQTLLADNALWPSWSPDGRKIVFAGPVGIYVINADGGGKTSLTIPRFASQLAWSPDGARIAFVGSSTSDTDIFLINPDGTGLVNLTQDPELEYEPRWSPDGAKLAFVTDKSPNRVAVVNRDGSGRTDLTNDPVGSDFEPDWSPDGRQIVFERYLYPYPLSGSVSEIYVMQSDGSDQRNVSNTPDRRNLGPNWSR